MIKKEIYQGREVVATVGPPIYSGSTVLFNSCEELWQATEGRYPGIVYGTDRMPSQREFEEHLAELEGAYATRTFQSGISAICNTISAFVSAGDHILLCENCYGPTLRFCKDILSRFGVQAGLIPASVGEDIQEYLKPNTRLVFLESPGSNTFELQDIRAVCDSVGGRDIVTMLDNTWATPLYLSPFELGIDVVIHSITKYISGHSDVLLGTASVNSKVAERFVDYYKKMELFASPQDCALALRGLHTLHVRLARHEESALQLAQWLESDSRIGRVLHPGLQSHPQHSIWKRDFTGSSGVFGLTFAEDYSREQIAAFVNQLEYFGIGYSWGGYKSLVTAGMYDRVFNNDLAGKMIIRLSIGLEDAEMLKADLEKGLSVLERVVD